MSENVTQTALYSLYLITSFLVFIAIIGCSNHSAQDCIIQYVCVCACVWMQVCMLSMSISICTWSVTVGRESGGGNLHTHTHRWRKHTYISRNCVGSMHNRVCWEVQHLYGELVPVFMSAVNPTLWGISHALIIRTPRHNKRKASSHFQARHYISYRARHYITFLRNKVLCAAAGDGCGWVTYVCT